jgi:tRNA nucleotidyltransferase (CCA-adding enzyme)
MPDRAKLIDKLSGKLPAEARALFDAVVEQANRRGFRAFLVGGTVRDLLLDRDSLDVDISIEGDAVSLAREVAAATGVKLAKTTVFGTATLVGQGWGPDPRGRFHLDLVSARAETYAHPGALPRVRLSTIDDDLLRRDITINSMALQLNGEAPGKLLDPTGGEADLKAGLVRVIHDKSFQDDATRILRAVRYATRFVFRLEEGTLDLLERDLRHLDRISGTRIRHELQRTFEEAEPERALSRLAVLGVLETIHPALRFPKKSADAFPRLRGLGAPVVAGWPLLCWPSSLSELPDLIRRLAMTRAQRDALLAQIDEANLARAKRPSQVVHLLDGIPLPTVYAFAAVTGSEAAERYLREWRGVRPLLRGDDAVGLGVERGPEVAEVLRELRAVRLDGDVKTRADEKEFVEAYLARERISLG